MSTLGQFAAEMKSWFSQIDPLATTTLVQRAYRDIRKSRDWSFNVQNGVWLSPSPISTGTVTVTFLSTQVACDATAYPFWAAQATTAPPLCPLTQRQFRVTGGPIYNIVGFSPNTPSPGLGTITLDRPYTEQSASGGSYYIFQNYAAAPTLDFKRWLSWTDPINDYRFRRRNLYRTKEELDRMDPQRTSYSWPYIVATHDYTLLPGDTQMRPRFEIWPLPSQQIGYVTEWLVNGEGGVSLNSVLPPQISDETIMARARHYGHQVVANQPNVDVKVKAWHLNAMRAADAEYVDLLNKDKMADNSIFDSLVNNEDTGPVLNGPLDANFLQSHELFLIP
jgi:hypothetical protein